jgi:hypothetical protein
VQDDTAQPPGLGVDVVCHASILTTRTPVDALLARFGELLFASA